MVLLCVLALMLGYMALAYRDVYREGFFQFADGTKVCNNVFFFEMDNFLSESQCDDLMDAAKKKGMYISRVGEVNSKVDNNIRKSEQAWFPHNSNDVALFIKNKVLDVIKTRMSGCFPGLDPEKSFEDVQVVKYGRDGKYDPHFDGTECGEDLKVDCLPNQRIATFLIYINDEFTGGETRFPNMDNMKVKPKKGKALFFWVSDPANRLVYDETLHGGDPVVTGEKWIATQWIRAQ